VVGLVLPAIPVGTAIGGLIGSTIHGPTEHREHVDAQRLQITVAPDLRGGIRGGLSWRF